MPKEVVGFSREVGRLDCQRWIEQVRFLHVHIYAGREGGLDVVAIPPVATVSVPMKRTVC